MRTIVQVIPGRGFVAVAFIVGKRQVATTMLHSDRNSAARAGLALLRVLS